MIENQQSSTPLPEQQPPQPSPDGQAEQTHDATTSKLPIILIIITVLSLATSVYFVYQNYLINQRVSQTQEPTPSPTAESTANWKTYTLEKDEPNVETAFSFKYPPDWEQQNNYTLQSNDSLITLEIALSGRGFQCAEKTSTENKKISGEQVTIDYWEAGATNEYCPESEKRYIVMRLPIINPEAAIFFYYEDSNADTAEEVFSKILSTFKFTWVSSDEIANWKTYQNLGIVFNYPDNWFLDAGGKRIASSSPRVTLYIFGPDDPMYNECMSETKRETKGPLLVKYYSAVQGTEACSNPETWDQREVWITKADGDGFQPGIMYSYIASQSTEAESIFDQILATFKFTE